LKQKNKLNKQQEKKYWFWAYLGCGMQACIAYLLNFICYNSFRQANVVNN